jgi:hypothetical protein
MQKRNSSREAAAKQTRATTSAPKAGTATSSCHTSESTINTEDPAVGSLLMSMRHSENGKYSSVKYIVLSVVLAFGCATTHRAVSGIESDESREARCRSNGLMPSEGEIDDTISAIKRAQGDLDSASFEKAIQSQGMTMGEYRRRVRMQLCEMRLRERDMKEIKNDT